MALLRVPPLPADALAASARFHAEVLPQVLEAIAADPPHLALVFPPADHGHRGWRLAVIQGLAREHAPLRVNAMESDDELAIAATVSYLDGAPGVTGQLWSLDATGAGRAT